MRAHRDALCISAASSIKKAPAREPGLILSKLVVVTERLATAIRQDWGGVGYAVIRSSVSLGSRST